MSSSIGILFFSNKFLLFAFVACSLGKTQRKIKEKNLRKREAQNRTTQMFNMLVC